MCSQCSIVGVILREVVAITCQNGKTITKTVFTKAVERSAKSKMSLYLHSHKILTIQQALQGKPCYLTILDNPCSHQEKYIYLGQSARAKPC